MLIVFEGDREFSVIDFVALWLDQSKTLRQQEIDEQSTVVLRRKYFFSDTNVDQGDPVQLNLLYVQVSLSSMTTMKNDLL